MPPEDEIVSPQQPTKREPAKRAQKPAFDEFLRLLRNAVDGTVPPTKKLSEIVRLLRKGFRVEDDIKQVHLDAISEVLASYDDRERLVLRLFADFPPSGKHLARFVRNRISSPYASSKGFPKERQKDDDRLSDLHQWIEAGSTRHDPDDERYPVEWVRHAFICLANEPDPEIRCLAIDLLLGAVERELLGARKEKQDPAYEYVRLVASSLGAGRVDELVKLRSLLYPEFLAKKDLLVARRESDAARIDAEDRCHKAESTVSALTRDLEAAQERVASLEAAVANGDRALKSAAEEAARREEHLTHEWQQRLSGQRHSVSKHMLHDIEEAIMCLSRNDPNVEMALSRIRNAEKTIRELE